MEYLVPAAFRLNAARFYKQQVNCISRHLSTVYTQGSCIRYVEIRLDLLQYFQHKAAYVALRAFSHRRNSGADRPFEDLQPIVEDVVLQSLVSPT